MGNFHETIQKIKSQLLELENNTKNISNIDKKFISLLTKAFNELDDGNISLSLLDFATPHKLKRLEKIDKADLTELEKAFSKLNKKVKTKSKIWADRVPATVAYIVDELDTDKVSISNEDLPKSNNARLEANSKAVQLIKEKGNNPDAYTKDEKETLLKFTGFGGLGRGDKDEYYTPDVLAKELWSGLDIKEGDTILDPSCGTGVFSRNAPKGVKVQGVDLNETSSTIANITNGNSEITVGKSFEEFAKNKTTPIYDGIITNVPFASREESMRNEDPDYKDIKRSEIYFILKSLDLLKEGKKALFITSSTTEDREQNREARLEMLKKGSFVGGYRLPSEVFKATGANVVTDILIFEKHDNVAVEKIAQRAYESGTFLDAVEISAENKDFLDGTYFKNRPKTTMIGLWDKKKEIGVFRTKDEQKDFLRSKALEEGKDPDKIHFSKIRDHFSTTLSFSEIMTTVKQNMKKLPNTFGYDELVFLDDGVTDTVFKDLKNDVTSALSIEDGEIRNSGEMELDTKSFLELLSQAEKAKVILYIYNSISLKKVALNNPTKDGNVEFIKNVLVHRNSNYVAEHSGIAKEYVEDTKRLSKLTSQLKEVVNSKILNNIISVLTSYDTELEYSNPLATKATSNDVTPNGNVLYELDSFTDDELAENEEVSLYVKDNKTYAVSTDDLLSLYDGTNYAEVEKSVTTMIDNSSVDDEIKAIKTQETLKRLKDFKHTKQIEHLSFNLSNVNFYLGDADRLYLYRKINDLGKSDIINTFKDKIQKAYQENQTTYNAIGINNTSIQDLEEMGGLIFETIAKVKFGLATTMQLGLRKKAEVIAHEKEKSPDKAMINEINNSLGAIVKSAFNDELELIEYYIKTVVLSDVTLKEKFKSALEDKSIVKTININSSDSSPMEELRGIATDELIGKARIYQNEDGRKFGTELKGTIAQDTGLGKTLTMLFASLKSLREHRAKRVLIITPNPVVRKVAGEFTDNLVDEWKKKTLVITTQTLMSGIRELKTNKEAKIIIAPHSIIDQLSLKKETIENLTFTKSGDGQKQVPTDFYSLIGTYPNPKGKVFFEGLGIDAIFIDEQQFFKNGVKPYNMAKAKPDVSDSAVMLQYIGEYIRTSRGDGRGVVSVTATPFTNSPTEIIANLALSGQQKDGFGKTIQGMHDHEDFKDNFLIEEEITRPKVNGMGVTTEKTFAGFSNFDSLKGIVNNGAKFRNAESEQKRVKGLKVKPNYDMLVSTDKQDDRVAEAFSTLAKLNDTFRITRAERKAGVTVDPNDVESVIKKTVGETFGFINRARILSVSHSMGYGVTKILIKKGTTVAELEKALKAKYFTFGLFKDGSLTLSELRALEIRYDFRSAPLSKNKNIAENSSIIQKFAPDFIEEKDGNTYFNAYTTDEEKMNTIVKNLQKAGIVTDKVFDTDDFPKYKLLIQNIKGEYERKKFSRQIVFSDKPIITQMIIKQLLEKRIADKELPEIKVHLFSKRGGLKPDKSNSLELQEDFNSSTTPDILVYGIGGITGVDFNKNVSAVHLMNIPETPDVSHQAMGRAVRQGNDMDLVKVYKYFTAGTFDSFLEKLVAGKDDWIKSLSDDKEAKDSVKVNTSSASQITSNALNMFADATDNNGEPLSVEDKVNKYMDYLKDEELKNQKDINTIKIKQDIFQYRKLNDEKKEIDRNKNKFILNQVYKKINSFESNFSNKPMYIVDFQNVRSRLQDLLSKDENIAQEIDKEMETLKNTIPKANKETVKTVFDNIQKVEEYSDELSEEIKNYKEEIKKQNKKLKSKKTDEKERPGIVEDIKRLMNRVDSAKSELDRNNYITVPTIDNMGNNTTISIDIKTLRFNFSNILDEVGGAYRVSKTTPEDIEDALNKIMLDKFKNTVENEVKNIIDVATNINKKIDNFKIDLLSKLSNKDTYNTQSVINLQTFVCSLEEYKEMLLRE